jgi:hypothetical protein
MAPYATITEHQHKNLQEAPDARTLLNFLQMMPHPSPATIKFASRHSNSIVIEPQFFSKNNQNQHHAQFCSMFKQRLICPLQNVRFVPPPPHLE